MTTFKASEVRTESRKQGQLHRQPASDMLNAFADRLEADEKSHPIYQLMATDDSWWDVSRELYEAEGSHAGRTRILYTHPATSDAERLAEALHSIGERLSSVLCDPFGEVVMRGSDDDRQIIAQALKDLGELAAHSAQAQPPAASVTDAMVERALSAYYVRDIDSAGFAWEDAVGDPRIAESDMRAALEAALAAQENHNG